MTGTLTLCALALVAEALVGYPTVLYRAIGHPVGWIGAALMRLDRGWNRDEESAATRRRWGAAALLGLLTLCGTVVWALQALAFAALPPTFALLLLALLASSCLAQRSLDGHVAAVAVALERTGLPAAREAVGAIVGRDTISLEESGIARAAIESLAENFADGVVAPAFWLAVLGLPGGVLYKAINTADSMIGHRTPRHAAFGFSAAKLDDLVNVPPARLAALWIVAAAALVPDASMREAWRVMRRDSRGHASPNAGWPEAAMAGALGLQLGGTRTYGARVVADATIGDGQARLDAAAIRRALRVYRVACAIEIGVAVAAALVIARWR